METHVHVYKDGMQIGVNDQNYQFQFTVPDVYPENFFCLIWFVPGNFCAYFTADQYGNNQQKFELEPTEENYITYVKPFVDQWENEKALLIPQQQLIAAKAERAEAVSKIVVEVDGMTFDGDEESQTRIGRTIAAAVALGVDINTYTQTWVLADNTIANPTIKQLAEALKLAGEQQTKLWTVPYE